MTDTPPHHTRPSGLSDSDCLSLFANQIHDLKNLLFVLISELDDTLNSHNADAAACTGIAPRLARLKFDGQMINDKLIQMLSVYRLDRGEYQLDIAYHPVAELLEDILAESRPLFDGGKITLDCDIQSEAGLCWFFDRDIVSGVINHAIHNALRSAAGQIRLGVAIQDGCLALSVADDGAGFPAEILARGEGMQKLDLSTGKTGLGLYFSAVCARLHANRDQAGRVEIRNGAPLGGAVFTLYLP